MKNMKMEAEIIYDTYLPEALRQALEYAGEDGFVASLPQLLQARVNASYDNIIWSNWFTSNSEESATKTPQGHAVVVVVHGGGIFARPERFRALFHADVSRFSRLGYTGRYAGKILEQEAHQLLDGKLCDGTEFPVFSFDEFRPGIAELPRRYAVVMDFDVAKNSENGYVPFDALREDPMMIVRAGGMEAAAAYLDKARARKKVDKTGSLHYFNDINTAQAQTWVPQLAGNLGSVGGDEDEGYVYGNDPDYGMGGDCAIHNPSMINLARYVAVAPRVTAASVRNIAF